MKTVQLTELLDDEQIKGVEGILKEYDGSNVMTLALIRYLSQFRAELEAKGVVPEYLAYVLIAKHVDL